MLPPRRPPDLTTLLAASPSETTPLLLELARRQAERRRPAELLTQYDRDRFVHLSALDQRTAHRLDGLALDAASDFEALLLSPVAPLGSCSVVAPTSQDRTLSTSRGTEVVSDPTNVLALECARRLRAAPATDVRLCTLHQVLRAQPLPPIEGYSRHFRLFALAEAGRARPEDGFEIDALVRHMRVFDRLFDSSAAAFGCAFPGRRAIIRTTPRRDALAERLDVRLATELPHVEVVRERLEAAYYDGVRVTFGASTTKGELSPIGDHGVFDWMGRLTANRRLRFVASGFGIQLVPVLFRASAP